MRLVHILPSRRRQALHCIITGAEQKSAQEVDEKVSAHVHLAHLITVALEERRRIRVAEPGVTPMRHRYCRESDVDDEGY